MKGSLKTLRHEKIQHRPGGTEKDSHLVQSLTGMSDVCTQQAKVNTSAHAYQVTGVSGIQTPDKHSKDKLTKHREGNYWRKGRAKSKHFQHALRPIT